MGSKPQAQAPPPQPAPQPQYQQPPPAPAAAGQPLAASDLGPSVQFVSAGAASAEVTFDLGDRLVAGLDQFDGL